MTGSFASNYNWSMKIDNTISRVSFLRESINKALIEEMNRVGLEGLVPSHGDILSKLFNEGELPKSKIADSIKKDKSTVTTLINKLIQHGYVKSRKNPEDSRSILVSLTDKGLALKSEVTVISKNIFERLFIGISDEEREAFRATLNKMIDNMQSSGNEK